MGDTNNTVPMTLEEVLKLKSIKGKPADEKISEIEKLTKILCEKGDC